MYHTILGALDIKSQGLEDEFPPPNGLRALARLIVSALKNRQLNAHKKGHNLKSPTIKSGNKEGGAKAHESH